MNMLALVAAMPCAAKARAVEICTGFIMVEWEFEVTTMVKIRKTLGARQNNVEQDGSFIPIELSNMLLNSNSPFLYYSLM
jgi:hypothetical protein